MIVLTWILIAAAADSAAIAPPSKKMETPVEETGLRQLLGIRRVYVDRLTGGVDDSADDPRRRTSDHEFRARIGVIAAQ